MIAKHSHTKLVSNSNCSCNFSCSSYPHPYHLVSARYTSTSNLEKGRERLELITRMNELQFEKAILPANKISQEMIQKIKDRINHMKISLRHRQLSKERIRILENDLNCLTHDLIKAAKLSGLGCEVTESRKRF